MGRHQGSIAARRGLAGGKRACALAAALLLAGCANSSVQVSTGTPQPAVSAQGSSPLGTLVLLGLIAGLGYESYKDGVHYRANPFDAMLPPARYPPLPLDPGRRVLEQDCTKPIEDWSANLKCR